MPRLGTIFGVSMALVMLGSGCGRPAREYDLVIMSPHTEKIQDEFELAFVQMCQEETGARPEISWRDQGGGTTTQVDFVRDQFRRKPDGIGVDVFFGGGMPTFLTLAGEGLLEPYEIPNLDQVAPDILGTPLSDQGHHYYGAALSGFGVIYNREMLKELGIEEPTSWETLADGRLVGLVAAVDPSKSGSAMMAYDVILQAYGWQKGMRLLTLMGANSRTFYDSAGDVPEEVGSKQAAVGCAIDFYAANQIAKSGAQRVGFSLPAGLTVVNPDPIGILKGAPHMDQARKFVAFVMSKRGQRLWFLPPGSTGGPRQWALYRMPVIPELYEEHAGQAMITYNPFQFKAAFEYDARLGSQRRNIFGDLFGATVIRPAERLKRAWRAVLLVKENEDLVQELVRPPVTEQELSDLAGKWTDEALRSRMTTQWTNDAVRKYDEIENRATNR